MVELNLKEEERLAEEIRKFSCLYDTGNTWREVGNALGYEEGT